MKIRISSRVPLVLLMPIVLLLAVGLEVACIKKTTGVVTPWEKVASYNAAFADLNQTIEQGAELAVSGNLLSKDAAAKVIDFTGRAATIHQQVTAVLAKGSNASAADLASLQGLLTEISGDATSIINSGAAGVKNPKSQQTFARDIAALSALAQAILSLVPQLQPAPPVTAMAAAHLGGDPWTL